MASNTVSIIIQAKDKASATLRGVEASSNSLASTISRNAKLVAVASGAALLATSVAAVKQAASYEQSRVAFETMLGSADRAKQMLSDISKFAATTPFELPGVVDASKQLLAFGVVQKDIIPTLRRLGDIAAGVGVPVGQLSYVYGQVRLTGKLMAQDLMQFTNAGVPLLDYLSKTMHKTTADIKKDMDKGAGPSFKQVQAAIAAMTDNGGKFGGMMEKQSHTFNGVVSNIKDGFGQILRSSAGITVTGDIIKGSLFDRLKQVAETAMPAVQKAAKDAGPMMIRLIDHIDAFVRRVRAAVEFAYRNRAAILAVATAVTVFFIPALVRAGITAVVTATKARAAALVTSTAWIRSAIATSAAFWTASAKIIASMTVTAARAVIHATAVSAAWVASAAKASAVWVVTELPRLIASFAVTAVKATLYAADTSLAWVLNAIRVSTVWTVTEMPKLVLSFITTSAAATVHAARASAAWVANAARASAAWVFTELPKIVLAFAVTSGAAVVHAATASGAWVLGASRAAIAWVVVQLPQIIKGFVLAAASAVANAAVAATAWTAAAIKSTQSYAAFRALVASPIAMGAIAIAGALADIALVLKAVQTVRQAISDMNAAARSKQNAQDSASSLHRELLDLQAHGNAGQKARASALLKKGYASGTNFARGGSALVGEHGPELVNLPRGSQVAPAWRTRSQQVSSGDTNITISGTVNLYTKEAADAFWNRIDKTQRLAQVGMA